ncbi:MAG: 3-oxoacyl-[acyl-carrier-protein] reductase [Spirochaetes bacterium]|jgi:3-oxoacyl-[acyl-carrier protein] reductase|nr:3-oxoacyl-[acyl-carrier-protein] reductase [Spirochaetota bacterium]
MLLKGKKAIVTGGARGIGKEIVMDFLREGASVTFIDLNPSDAQAEMEQAANASGAAVSFRAGDVSDPAGITALLEEIIREAGSIDILVNNAGITRDGLVFRMPVEQWEKVLKINLTSAFLCSQVVARHMIRQRRGSIINMASVVGIGGNAGQANYAASKAGLIGLTRSVAKEAGSRGVRVNAVAPGYIDTDMTRALPEQARQAFLTQVSLRRPGTPAEVARVVTFLASDMASYVSGDVLRVDGCMAI